MVLAIVDFPQPDSPTSPRVSFSYISKLTSSTAFTFATTRERRPFLWDSMVLNVLFLRLEYLSLVMNYSITLLPSIVALIDSFSNNPHPALCPSSRLNNGGDSLKHLSIAYLHLVLNLQPVGSSSTEGTFPLIEFNRSSGLKSIWGIESINPFVHGCFG